MSAFERKYEDQNMTIITDTGDSVQLRAATFHRKDGFIFFENENGETVAAFRDDVLAYVVATSAKIEVVA